MSKEVIIMGIDPGTNVMGFGAIVLQNDTPRLLGMKELRLNKIDDPHLKLKLIYEECQEMIEKFKPHEIAIEAPFYASNPQSMLKLGRAQGVAMAAVISKNVSVTEYSPRKVKKSITGKGAASKEQIAQMLVTLLNLHSIPTSLDVSDALAVALCHSYNRKKSNPNRKNYGSWRSYIKDNPHKLYTSNNSKG